MKPMPRFVSHKTVEGFKIGSITPQALGTHAGNVVPPKMFMGKPCAQKTEYVVVSECGDHTVVLDDDYIEKHHPHLGGYFVQYADGYQSFSPADAFESGYVQTTKRRVMHLTIDDSLDFTVDDMENMLHMFTGVIHGDLVDAANIVVATLDGVRAEFVDVQDSPEVELVSIHLLEDAPFECDADGKRIIRNRSVSICVDGHTQPTAEQFVDIVKAFAPLIDVPEIEVDHPDVLDYSVEAFTEKDTSELLISVTIKD